MFSSIQKFLLAILLIPAVLGISFANICRCIEADCHPSAQDSSYELIQGHHHGHSHHHDSSHEPSSDEPVTHECDHRAEPMVHVDCSTAIPILPLVMIYVECLKFYSLSDFTQEYVYIDTSPPLLRSVLIEPYRPLLI